MAVDKLVLANFDMGGVARIKNLPAAAAAGDPVRQQEFEAAIQGLAWKDNVRVATQSNLTLSSPGATIDGVTMASGDRVLVRAQTLAAANGIYVWSGASSTMSRADDASTAAELESAIVVVDEGTSEGATFRQTAVNFVLNTDPITWGNFSVASTTATESASGVSELATQAETDAGVDDARIVTPLKYKTSTLRPAPYAANFGDGSATQFDLTHNLNTRDVIVQVYRVASPYDEVACGVERLTVNAVRLNFVSAPTTNQFRVNILRLPSA